MVLILRNMRSFWRAGRPFIVAATFALAVTACAQSPRRVTTDVFTCCEAEFQRYSTYQVRMTNAPGFLEPYLRGGVQAALNRKGLTETLDQPDVMVEMIFDQIFLTPESQATDYFGEGVEPGRQRVSWRPWRST